MPKALILHLEGDSISVGGSWALLAAKQSGQSWTLNAYAVSSAVIRGAAGSNSIEGREATVAAAYVADAINVLFLFIGANCFSTTTTATNEADMTALASYCARMRARGFYVALGTMLPKGTTAPSYANFNANRTTYNPRYRALLGVSVHAIIDFAADQLMGPAAAGSDLTLFNSDGIHPTSLGKGHMCRVALPVLDSFGRAAAGGPLANGVDTRRFRLVA